MITNQLRVRYAPSPTGHLHIGGARTALFDYLIARANQGAFIIRFEDTDQSRHVESGIDSQLNGLKWLGLEWDESVDIGGPFAPYRQTQRLALYQPYIEQLVAAGNAYLCYCSEVELEEERSAQENRGETPIYGGKCRHLSTKQILEFESVGRKPSLRFLVNTDAVITFEDRVRGHMEFESMGIGDFIIVRADGIPTYNFAVILDDYLMEITHVIRGEEHLSNTPKQIMLYQALSLPIPQFAHLSLILNTDRKKMSKRDGSIIQFIDQYKELGYLPEAVLNYISLLGWSPKGEEEIFTKEELISQFDLDRVSKSPAVFDMEKLNWMNNHYIKIAHVSRIVDLAVPHLQKAGYVSQEMLSSHTDWITHLIRLYQDRMSYVSEIVELSKVFFEDEIMLNEECLALLAEAHTEVVLSEFILQLNNLSVHTPEDMQVVFKNVQKETGFKGKQLFMTIRVAVTGQQHGPDLHMTLYLLGKEKVIRRIQKLL
jgi:nondiscriminating glutamyl-tRNA synthetase